MAPIVCKAYDSTNNGLKGLHAVLECRDQCQNTLSRYESYTNDIGVIDCWFPFPKQGDTGVINPECIDSLDFPRVSITFFPGPYLMTAMGPWVSIRTDLYLLGIDQHEIILRMSNEDSHYELEYHKIPAMDWLSLINDGSAGPPRQSLTDPDRPEIPHRTRAPSPATSASEDSWSWERVRTVRPPRRSSRKRKSVFCDDVERPSKRRRC